MVMKQSRQDPGIRKVSIPNPGIEKIGPGRTGVQIQISNWNTECGARQYNSYGRKFDLLTILAM
jgi:hypothetical protein